MIAAKHENTHGADADPNEINGYESAIT